MSKQWGGRFSGKTHKTVEIFTESISMDWRLFQEDIAVSKAHAWALSQIKLITRREYLQMEKALDQIEMEFISGKIEFQTKLEDVHSHIEVALKQKIGDLASKLHTGRSRNDQVATGMRLFLKKNLMSQIEKITELQRTLILLAKKNIKLVMPGYTHLQRAQPIRVPHYFLAYFEMLQRDKKRFLAAFSSADSMPLGAAALAGSAYPLPRDAVAAKLGFSRLCANSLDAVSDRDFVLDYLYAVSMFSTHLSRMAEDLILWMSSEFAFIELPDAFTTGSSLMPQKKNPDVLELTRGQTGLFYGYLQAMLTMLKGLPLSYNRDLQADKRVFFDSIDRIHELLDVFVPMLEGIKFNGERLDQALQGSYLLATDLADYLVSKKIAFRVAHEITGRIVRRAIELKLDLPEIPLRELQLIEPQIQKDIYEWLEIESSLEKRNVLGGTAMKQVQKALNLAERRTKQID